MFGTRKTIERLVEDWAAAQRRIFELQVGASKLEENHESLKKQVASLKKESKALRAIADNQDALIKKLFELCEPRPKKATKKAAKKTK